MRVYAMSTRLLIFVTVGLLGCGADDLCDGAACQMPLPNAGREALFCDDQGTTPPIPAIATPGRRTEAAWRDMTETLGLPLFKSRSASAADMNGDGWADVLAVSGAKTVWTATATEAERPLTQPELFIRCADRFHPLGLAERIRSGTLQTKSASSMLVDLDGDGKRDIVLGGFGQIQILWNAGGLTFDAQTLPVPVIQGSVAIVSLGVYDLNGDGLLDIHGSALSNTMVDMCEEPVAPDPIFVSGGHRQFANVTPHLPKDIYGCVARQIMVNGWISRAPFGLPPLLYVGADNGKDCLLEVLQEDSGVTLRALTLPAYEECIAPATMGMDFMLLENGEVIIGISDVGRMPIYRVHPSGQVDDLTLHVDYGPHTRIGWGVAMFDAENDGIQDLSVAYGFYSVPPEGLIEVSEEGRTTPVLLLNSLRHYRGRFDDDGAWWVDDVSAAAGPAFTPGNSGSDDLDIVLADVQSVADVEAMRRDWFAVVEVDIDLDGCSDLLATPFPQFEADCPAGACRQELSNPAEAKWRFKGEASVTLLRNTCDYGNRWLGFHLPDLPGAVVEVVVEASGVQRTHYRQVKGAYGVAASGDMGRLRFGLGSDETLSIQSATVWWTDGTSKALEPADLTLDRYHVVAPGE
ncbi:MAG: hypothetical protein ACI9WU_000106 [Myxococcota bacterium]|jgi:hypothetical protein